MLLAIDSATRFISLALHDGHELLAEHTWPGGNRHSVEIPPQVELLLARAKQDLSALAVACGPGSFTGLRVGVALAKGLAAARGLPLVAVRTQDIVAAAQPPCPGHVLLVLLSVGRGRHIAARYRRHGGQWKARGEEELTDLESLLRPPAAPALIAGDLDANARATLMRAQEAGFPLRLASPSQSLRRAGFLAEIALERLQKGMPGDFAAGKVSVRYVATLDTP